MLFRDLLGFLDEGVQDHDFLPLDRTKQGSADPFWAFGPDLEQALALRRGVRAAKRRAKFLNQLKDMEQICQYPGRQRQCLAFDFLAKKRGRPCHSVKLS